MIEQLNKMIENDELILSCDEFMLSIKYQKRLNCFVWCNKEGKQIIDLNDRYYVKRVILSPNIINRKWRFENER